MTDEKFIFNACSVLGLYSVEIKSDDGYQIGRRISSDNYRPIFLSRDQFYPMRRLFQWEPEEINNYSNESPKKLFVGL